MVYDQIKQPNNQSRELAQLAAGFYLQMGMMHQLQSCGIPMKDSFIEIWEEYWDRGLEIYQQMAPEDTIVIDQLIANTLRINPNLSEERTAKSIEKIINSLHGYRGKDCLDIHREEDAYLFGVALNSMKHVA